MIASSPVIGQTVCVSVDDRKFACDWPDCRKSFLHVDNLSAHCRQHTEPKPFRCDQCPLAYWQKSSLRSHQHKTHGQTTYLAPASAPAVDCTDGQLVDGIIKSVSASLQAASDHSARPPSNSVSTSDLPRDSQLSEACVTQCEIMDHPRSTVVIDSHDKTEQTTSSAVDEPSDDLASRPTLNVYEFCDDETVDIRRPKPSRATVAQTTIEQPQTTIELNHCADDDSEDHDLIAFDDDVALTVDRLAETIITYSRKKKLQPTGNKDQDVKLNTALSDDVNVTKKKLNKRKSSVAAGKRQKRQRTAQLEEVSKESVKRRTRTKRNKVDDGDEGSLSRQPLASRTSRRCRKAKEKTSAKDEADTQVSSARTGEKTETRRGKSNKAEVMKNAARYVKGQGTAAGQTAITGATQPAITTAGQSDITAATHTAITGAGQTAGQSSISEAAVMQVDEPRRKKVKRRKTTATRRSSRRTKVKEDEDEVDDNNEQDTAAASVHELTSDVRHSDDDGATEADDYLSDNTEILSLTENTTATATAVVGDDDDDDDAELTHRSSPASYKSDECQRHVMVTACQDEMSGGNQLIFSTHDEAHGLCDSTLTSANDSHMVFN